MLPTGISQAKGIVTLKAEFGAWLPLSFSSSQTACLVPLQAVF